MGSHVTFEAVFREDGMGKLRHESWSVRDLTLDVLASGLRLRLLSLVLCLMTWCLHLTLMFGILA